MSDETPIEPDAPAGLDPGSDSIEAATRPRRRLFRKRSRDEADDVRPAAQPEAEPGLSATPEQSAEESEPTGAGAPKPGRTPSRSSIKRDRQRLDGERQEAQFHLGGLALELFRRDALTESVLRGKAAQLIDLDEQVRLLDWRLEAIETERRERKGMEPPVAGACLSCGAEFAPEAAFCWRCGVRFAPETRDQSALTAEIGTIEE